MSERREAEKEGEVKLEGGQVCRLTVARQEKELNSRKVSGDIVVAINRPAEKKQDATDRATRLTFAAKLRYRANFRPIFEIQICKSRMSDSLLWQSPHLAPMRST